MQEAKAYYLIEGRLDLSTLDFPYKKLANTKEEILNNKQLGMQEPKVYKNEEIDAVLREMGDFFSSDF